MLTLFVIIFFSTYIPLGVYLNKWDVTKWDRKLLISFCSTVVLMFLSYCVMALWVIVLSWV